jgi:hypothetical protein
MIVSTNQPFFSPFPGFFSKARLSDAMVILDDVQFPLKSTWVTRNRFKNDQGTLWIRVPVRRKGLGLQRIKEVRICYEGDWTRKSLVSLKTSYGKAPFIKDHEQALEEMFSPKFPRLVDLNLMTIRYLMRYLGIATPLILQSELGIRLQGVPLLIEICRRLGASGYLAQVEAKKHLDRVPFEEAGIGLRYSEAPSPVYPQLWGKFIPDLSAFDLLLNCGPKSQDILWGSGNH